MAVSTFSAERQACFQFKASFLPCTILQIIHSDLSKFEHHLIETINKAPQFFQGVAVVIDLDKVKELASLPFLEIKSILIKHQLIPIGVQGGQLLLQQIALESGLPTLTLSKSTAIEQRKAKTENEESHKEPQSQSSKLIATPIRSGMQVYAKESDLVVTAAVSPGAELFADGNIHVYSTLRGRALAGVQGNKEARIFCRSLDAELVSIAGYYLTKEDIHALSLPEGMMQIYLDNEQVRIEAI